MSRNVAKTRLQSHFAQAVHADGPRSTFKRDSTLKTTFNCGDLVPVYLTEVLPGDTVKVDLSFVARLTTPLFPTMDVIHLDFYAFFVPNRIVWDGWEELMGENKTGAWAPSTPPALVPVALANITAGGLGDYYGLPPGLNGTNFPHSLLPFRGYFTIWNEWFRCQNTQAPVPVSKGNTAAGQGYMPNAPLAKANKKHDYFTSCLPAPQKGESALIPIELNELIPVITGAFNNSPLEWAGPVGPGPITAQGSLNVGAGGVTVMAPSTLVKPHNLFADGRNVNLSASTISELRTAFQIQKLYERDARGGTRYSELLKAHFGVDAQDYRLQRPEFLGHYHTHIGIQQVPQTSSSVTGSPQGNVAAFSYTSAVNKFLFKKSFVEHGYIHVFAVARHPKTYQYGVEKHWFRRERLDFYLPVLSHISEQPVYNKEIFAVGISADFGNEVFGWNEAWADYRYKPNAVTGQMRHDVPGSRSIYHYADRMTGSPYLSAEWMADNSRMNVDRTLSVSSSIQDQIAIDIAFGNKSSRRMPVYSIPGLVDHF